MKNPITLLLLTIIITNSVLARLPLPRIPQKTYQITQQDRVSINAENLIANYPSLYIVKLENSQSKEKIAIKVISVTENLISLALPYLDYGDYNLHLKLKSQLLKSPKLTLNNFLQVRPSPPPQPRLLFNVINNEWDLDNILHEQDYQGQELFIELNNNELALNNNINQGINYLSTYYYQGEYRSLSSPPQALLYLPEFAVETELDIRSESPLASYAVLKPDYYIKNLINNSNNLQNSTQSITRDYNVSDYTITETQNLSKSFYLVTPNNPKYLEHRIELKPVFIAQLHVIEPESILLKSRLQEAFSLNGCTLSDNIKQRKKFTKEIIPPQGSFYLEADLGLNNSGGDALSFDCAGSNIDKLSYTSLDADGYAKP